MRSKPSTFTEEGCAGSPPHCELRAVEFPSYWVTTSCSFVLDDSAGLCEVAVTVTV